MKNWNGAGSAEAKKKKKMSHSQYFLEALETGAAGKTEPKPSPTTRSEFLSVKPHVALITEETGPSASGFQR